MTTYVIAEAGVNHNGSLELALRLIDAAAQAGADAVKFQTFQASRVISAHAPKCEYQIHTTAQSQSQQDMIRQLELRQDWHPILAERCHEQNITFLSTGFDEPSVRFLAEDMGVAAFKIPSGEVTNAPLLLTIAGYGRPMMMSSGMCTLGELETALGILAFGLLKLAVPPSPEAFHDAFVSAEGQTALARNVTLLHCTSEYPAAYNEVNLKVMQTMSAAFGLPVGLSDHTPGIAIPIAATALGAAVIEKHFTLDRTMTGPDHLASIEPDELGAMIAGIRATELALGSAVKRPTPAEWKNRAIIRRSLVAARPIAAGETFTPECIDIKRPGNGISPLRYWALLGRKASRAYDADELISAECEF